MKAQELRIGNLIGRDLAQFPHNHFEVLEVAETNMKVQQHNDVFFWSDEDMEGIPLDTYWFNHYGFSRGADPWGGWLSSPLEDGSRLRIMDDLYYDAGFSKAPVKYVHNLQNLWFSLTGKELKRV